MNTINVFYTTWFQHPLPLLPCASKTGSLSNAFRLSALGSLSAARMMLTDLSTRVDA